MDVVLTCEEYILYRRLFEAAKLYRSGASTDACFDEAISRIEELTENETRLGAQYIQAL